MLTLSVNVTNFVSGKPLIAVFGSGVNYIPSPTQEAITGAEVFRTSKISTPSFPTATIVSYTFEIPVGASGVFSFGEFVLMDPTNSLVFGVGVLDIPQPRTPSQNITVTVYFDISQTTPRVFGTSSTSSLAVNIPFYGSINGLPPVNSATANMAICQSPYSLTESILALYTQKSNQADFDSWTFSNYTLVGSGRITSVINSNIVVLSGASSASNLSSPGQYILQTPGVTRICDDLTIRTISGVPIPTVTLDNQALPFAVVGTPFKLYVFSGSSSTALSLVNALSVTASQINAVASISAALILKSDGSVPMTSDLKLNGFKAVGSGTAVQGTDVPNLNTVNNVAALSTTTIAGISNSVAAIRADILLLASKVKALGG